MGCGCSTDAAAGGHGPAPENLEDIPGPTLEELRMHREIDHLDFYSDALTAEEPSPFGAAVSMRARLIGFRLSHGINDDPMQFDEEVKASVPHFLPEDYAFCGEWADDNAAALNGEPPAPIQEGPPVPREPSRTSTRTQAASVERSASGARPNHLRLSSSSSLDGADEEGQFRSALPVSGRQQHNNNNPHYYRSPIQSTMHHTNNATANTNNGSPRPHLPPLHPSPHSRGLSPNATALAVAPADMPHSRRRGSSVENVMPNVAVPRAPSSIGRSASDDDDDDDDADENDEHGGARCPKTSTAAGGSPITTRQAAVPAAGVKYLLRSPATESGTLEPVPPIPHGNDAGGESSPPLPSNPVEEGALPRKGVGGAIDPPTAITLHH